MAIQTNRWTPTASEPQRRPIGDVQPNAMERLELLVTTCLARYSIILLRISLGLVFLGFGALKFVPGASPAEDIAKQTMHALTLGLIPGSVSLVLVAAMESTIGLSLITGRHLRIGLTLLGLAMVGVLSPLLLFPGQLFAGTYHAPTLEGQYVLKDVVLLAAGLVVVARELGGRMVMRPVRQPGAHDAQLT